METEALKKRRKWFEKRKVQKLVDIERLKELIDEKIFELPEKLPGEKIEPPFDLFEEEDPVGSRKLSSEGLIGSLVDYKFSESATIRCTVESVTDELGPGNSIKWILTPLAGNGNIVAFSHEIEFEEDR